MRRSTLFILSGLAGVVGIGAGVAFAEKGVGRHGGGAYDSERGEMRRGGWRGRERTKENVLERARSRFARIDVDSDGTLSRDEITSAMTRRMEGRRGRRMERRLERMQRRLARADTNRDGTLTAEEFQARADRRFARFDVNGDGRIDDADLPPGLRGRDVLKPTSSFQPRRRRAGRMIRRLRAANANGDNVVTKAEAMDFVMKRFARLDRDGSGAVNADDRTAFRQQVVDYRVARFLNRFDATDAGSVSRDAFLKRAEERFDRLDINGDGTISREERGRRGWRRGRHRGSDDRGSRRDHRGDGRGRDWL